MNHTFKKGDIVKFAKLIEGDKPEDRYLVMDVWENNAYTSIKKINSVLAFPPVNDVRTTDLILGE